MQHLDIEWETDRLAIRIAVGDDRVARLAHVAVDGATVVDPRAPLPLVEVGVVGEGRSWSSRRFVDSVVGTRATYLKHDVSRTDHADLLVISTEDAATGLRFDTTMLRPHGCAGIRMSTTVHHGGTDTVTLAWIASLVVGGALGDAPEQLQVLWADNDWLAESRWRSEPVRSVLPDLNRVVHDHDPRGVFGRTAQGAWSTDGYLPIGVLTHPADGRTLAWQIEHNGAWHWQIGEREGGVYLSALGPTDIDHQAAVVLEPGDRFVTVPVTLAASTGGFTGVVAEFTALRRAGRHDGPDLLDLPVIFNDYMNTISGDPTTEKLLPLVDSAAEVGAEVFVIDAGWYDDDADGWWDSVGEWLPSMNRFPGGIGEVLDRIRSHGMVAGLWLEPEVVGVRSPLAGRLPAEAFFRRGGRRVVENGRYQLDFRHPAVRDHLDGVVDRLVGELGAGYLKLDYNINPGAGTDVDASSAGAGLLGHNRAYVRWLETVRLRHPSLTLESCASGGMRVDYALLSVAHLQSTSDQQDPHRYPPIAAAAAAAVTPEQAASWAYPQPSFSRDDIAFTLSTPMLGRMHLSGHVDQMSADQCALVSEAVAAYRAHRGLIGRSVPFWPLGLPGWDDGWVAHGLLTERTALVTVWRRDCDTADTVLDLSAVGLGDVSIVYPRETDAGFEPVVTASQWRLNLPRRHQAVTLRIDRR